MPVGFFFIHCILFICSLDFDSFLSKLNAVSQLDWSFDSQLNFDPVRDAAAQNAAAFGNHTNSTEGGGPSLLEGHNSSVDDVRPDTDTRRLGDYLSTCGKGNATFNCGLEYGSNNYGTPQTIFLSRIWAHVKAEHPEFLTTFTSLDGTVVREGVVSDSLINNIYGLNKNYPGHWPR
jgi:hypothetical protein